MAARAGSRTTSPARRPRPPGCQTLRKPSDHASRPSDAAVRSTADDQPVPGREAGVGVLDGRGEDGVARRAGPSVRARRPRSGPRRAPRSRAGPRSGIRSRPRSRSACAEAAARRPPRAVERDLLAGRLVPHEPERVAADPAAAGHDDAQDGVGRDRRVDGVAPGGQHREPGGRREVMRRDDRAAGATGDPRRTGRGTAAAVSHPPSRPPRARRSAPGRRRPGARSRRNAASGRSATPRNTNETRKMPSSPARRAASPPSEAADDLAQAEEHRVQAHDRAAVVRVGLGHVGEQADRRGRRPREDEQAGRRDDRRAASSSDPGCARRWLIAERAASITAPPTIPYRMIVVRRIVLNLPPQ